MHRKGLTGAIEVGLMSLLLQGCENLGAVVDSNTKRILDGVKSVSVSEFVAGKEFADKYEEEINMEVRRTDGEAHY